MNLGKLLALLVVVSCTAGCATAASFSGSSFFGNLPPCENGIKRWCEGTTVSYRKGRKHVDITEYGASDDKYRPAGYSLKSMPRQYYFLWCGLEDREVEPIRCRSNRFEEIHKAKSFSDIQYCFAPPSDECRKARDYARKGKYTTHRQRINENIITNTSLRGAGKPVSNEATINRNASTSTDRLRACDSFGFQRGTQAHAECAMKLYMNEQGSGATSSNVGIAREQAIASAKEQEQKRIRKLEESLRGIQIGLEIMSGTSSAPIQSKTYTQTYNINGQIISCTTTGSITTCL